MKSFGPERAIAEQGWPRLSEAEEKLYQLIVPENKKSAIRPEGFVDLYGREIVQKDQARVAELEKKFAEEEANNLEAGDWRKRGELFEAIVNDQVEASNWLGEDASVIVPSRYDDIENGVDTIIEFDQEMGRSHLALAVDVTKSKKQIDKKLEAVRDTIERGQLSRVKYFSSRDLRGELREVPRVIVGAGENTMQEVAELLLLFKTRQKYPAAGKPGEFKAARERLEHHRLQFQLLFEIRKQLQAFAEHAHRVNQTKVAEKYEKTLQIISTILDQKNEQTHYFEGSPELDDPVYYAIMYGAGYFGK